MKKVSYYCRKCKENSNGKSPLEASFECNGKRFYITLPKKMNPYVFANELKDIKINDTKEYLNEITIKINNLLTQMLNNDIVINSENFKKYFSGKFEINTTITINQVFNEFLAQFKQKVEVGETAQKTYDKYVIAVDRFLEFFGGGAKSVKNIKNNDITNFRLWMKTEHKYIDSTCALYLSRIKTILTFSHNNGYISINPFAGIKIVKKLPEIEFLTKDELDTIANHKFIGRLEQIRDLFVFASHTGLSYSDMALISKFDIQVNEGVSFIKKPRQKTGVYFTALLDDDAMNILVKYDYRLPIISNQKYNAYLKEIADVCQITKPLHSHIARHTAATLMLNKGFNIEMVAKILGHSNIRMTQHYAKVLDDTLFTTFRKLNN